MNHFFLPYIIVSIMTLFSPLAFSQGEGRLGRILSPRQQLSEGPRLSNLRPAPGGVALARMARFRQGNHVPAPPAPYNPVATAIYFPPGVAREVTNGPLPTINPLLDVDLSVPARALRPLPLPTQETDAFFNPAIGVEKAVKVTPPAPNRPVPLPEVTPPRRLQSIPVFSRETQAGARGKFISFTPKEDNHFSTSRVILQEEEEEPIFSSPPAISPSPQIIGPITPSKPMVTPPAPQTGVADRPDMQNTGLPDESDPFVDVLDDENEVLVIDENEIAPEQTDTPAESDDAFHFDGEEEDASPFL